MEQSSTRLSNTKKQRIQDRIETFVFNLYQRFSILSLQNISVEWWKEEPSGPDKDFDY